MSTALPEREHRLPVGVEDLDAQALGHLLHHELAREVGQVRVVAHHRSAAPPRRARTAARSRQCCSARSAASASRSRTEGGGAAPPPSGCGAASGAGTGGGGGGAAAAAASAASASAASAPAAAAAAARSGRASSVPTSRASGSSARATVSAGGAPGSRRVRGERRLAVLVLDVEPDGDRAALHPDGAGVGGQLAFRVEGLAAEGLAGAAGALPEHVGGREVVGEAPPLLLRGGVEQPHQEEEGHHGGDEVRVGHLPRAAVVAVPDHLFPLEDDGRRRRPALARRPILEPAPFRRDGASWGAAVNAGLRPGRRRPAYPATAGRRRPASWPRATTEVPANAVRESRRRPAHRPERPAVAGLNPARTSSFPDSSRRTGRAGRPSASRCAPGCRRACWCRG